MFVLLLALLLPACTPDDKPDTASEDGVDVDEDGYEAADDCDDSDPLVNPGADEECDGIDNNCDGATDDDGEGVGAWYADVDGDTYGDLYAGVLACEQPPGTVADSTDCNDAEAASFPDNPEVCDGIDNDCDGRADEGATDIIQSFEDLDGDGYGNSDVDNVGCTLPDGYSLERGDCADADPTINPSAVDVCGDGIDQDCVNGDAVCG
ncbi:MAG: putative metal-binding motif-containing protein [Pseudomonadota bacterium]|nr:putative metal-binding motif-containing protein [Pseudomonadota bacterium]